MRHLPRLAALIPGIGAVLASCLFAASPATAGETPAHRPHVLVHKSASCVCCGRWIEHLRAAGHAVESRDTDELAPIKDRLGVPVSERSCHTAEVAGYFVEGHVPAADLERLLSGRPAAKGLAAPGMPIGSPGMEMPGAEAPPYDVHLVGPDGSVSVFSTHR